MAATADLHPSRWAVVWWIEGRQREANFDDRALADAKQRGDFGGLQHAQTSESSGLETPAAPVFATWV